ncbi:YxlC family protein [Paenibacillus sp. GCM10028914]|uniref:YxlC family protein n=1 Tax=Paenibacillus sp. GCM10028914 TaxID=3273416 RepID=UPI003607575C
MTNRADQEDEQFITELKAELNRIDSAVDEPAYSFVDFKLLAETTLANQRRRWRNENIIFMIVVVFIVSGVFLATWTNPGMLLLIHGISMLLGAVFLIVSLRSGESRDYHEE